jgi:hypothetical protein
MSKADNLRKILNNPKHRDQKNLKFPSDLDSNGSGNVIRFKISLPSESKYFTNKQYKKMEDADGNTVRPEYRKSGSSNSVASRFGSNYSMTSTTIDLYMPPNIQSSDQSEWGSTELGKAGMAIEGFKGAFNSGDIGKDLSQAWQSVKETVPRALMNTFAGTLQGVSPVNAMDAVKAKRSEMMNPYTEVLFNGVKNRTFSFTFKMIPRNRKEQETIQIIVREFRFHSAPEYASSAQNMYMRFPSEFDIEFIHRGQRNPWLFRISTCALTNVSVNHSPEGQYSSFADGSPSATELTLEFTELELLTKERHREGF